VAGDCMRRRCGPLAAPRPHSSLGAIAAPVRRSTLRSISPHDGEESRASRTQCSLAAAALAPEPEGARARPGAGAHEPPPHNRLARVRGSSGVTVSGRAILRRSSRDPRASHGRVVDMRSSRLAWSTITAPHARGLRTCVLYVSMHLARRVPEASDAGMSSSRSRWASARSTRASAEGPPTRRAALRGPAGR